MQKCPKVFKIKKQSHCKIHWERPMKHERHKRNLKQKPTGLMCPCCSPRPPLPESSWSVSSWSGPPFHSEEMVEELPPKIRPPKVAGDALHALSLLGHSRTKGRSQRFPKPRETPQPWFEELRILIRAYDPELHPLVHSSRTC